MPEDSNEICRVEQRSSQQAPRAGADERYRVEGEATGKRGNAEQPQHKHEFLRPASRHLMRRRHGAAISCVRMRPIPCEQRQQSSLHANHHLPEEAHKAEDAMPTTISDAQPIAARCACARTFESTKPDKK